RQVDAHEPDRLPRHADRGGILAQQSEGERLVGRRVGPDSQQGDRVRVPDVQPAPAGERPPQRGAAADLRRTAGSRAARQGGARAAPDPPARRPDRARREDGAGDVSRCFAVAALAVLALACEKAETAPLYEKVPVERRDVVVTVISQGVIRPTLLFSVKSKA